MAEQEPTVLLLSVLKELKELKKMVAKNTKQLFDLQATVDAMTYHKDDTDIDITFPIRTLKELDEVEEMMQDDEGRKFITTQLKAILRKDDDMWLLKIFDENLILDFNLTPSARAGKRGVLTYSVIEFALRYLDVSKRTISYCMKLIKDRVSKRKLRREKAKSEQALEAIPLKLEIDEDDSSTTQN